VPARGGEAQGGGDSGVKKVGEREGIKTRGKKINRKEGEVERGILQTHLENEWKKMGRWVRKGGGRNLIKKGKRIMAGEGLGGVDSAGN